jgi:hypothetical protein
MAKNLREKINKSDTMVINDVNDAATQKFVEEVGNVTIAKSVREVAEQTVRRTLSIRGRDEKSCLLPIPSLMMLIVLSMILSAMLHSDYILTIHKI